jgi:hypothetical protein
MSAPTILIKCVQSSAVVHRFALGAKYSSPLCSLTHDTWETGW